MLVLQLYINNNNDDTSKIKTYVGDDGLIHFTNSAGADSVLPFNSGVSKISISYLSAYNYNGTNESTAEGRLYLTDLDPFTSLYIGSTSAAFNNLFIYGYNSSGTSTTLYSYSGGPLNTSTISNKSFDITNYVRLDIFISRYSNGGTKYATINNIVIS